MHILQLDDSVGLLLYLCVFPKGRKDAVDKLLVEYAPNAVCIPSSSHRDIIAGQGTIAMEILEQESLTVVM